MSHDGYYWYFEYGKSWNEWEKDMVVVLRYYSSCASIVQFYEQQTSWNSTNWILCSMISSVLLVFPNAQHNFPKTHKRREMIVICHPFRSLIGHKQLLHKISPEKPFRLMSFLMHSFKNEIAETLRQRDPQKLPHNRQQPNTSAREREATESPSRPKIPASIWPRT